MYIFSLRYDATCRGQQLAEYHYACLLCSLGVKRASSCWTAATFRSRVISVMFPLARLRNYMQLFSLRGGATCRGQQLAEYHYACLLCALRCEAGELMSDRSDAPLAGGQRDVSTDAAAYMQLSSLRSGATCPGQQLAEYHSREHTVQYPPSPTAKPANLARPKSSGAQQH